MEITAGIFFGGDNENVITACYSLGLSEDNKEFPSFLCWDNVQNILTEKSLSIHIESGNIFYDSFSMNKNFYNFLVAQQEETLKLIGKAISYHR